MLEVVCPTSCAVHQFLSAAIVAVGVPTQQRPAAHLGPMVMSKCPAGSGWVCVVLFNTFGDMFWGAQ